MAHEQDPLLEEGDMARIIQPDSNGWGHNLKVGDVVQLDRYDSADNSWFVQVNPGTPEVYASWVDQNDLAPDFDPVTEDEIAELFGLKEN